jgi:hypothetical protein
MIALVTLDVLTSVGRATQSKEPILVYDPFMGVGTTGMVAMALGCCFIGLDSDEKCQHAAELLLIKARKKNADGITSRWCTGGALYREEDTTATGDGDSATEVITKSNNSILPAFFTLSVTTLTSKELPGRRTPPAKGPLPRTEVSSAPRTHLTHDELLFQG